MKNTFINILIVGLLVLPFAIIYQLYQELIPFHLTGKQFLVFFISHSWSIYFAVPLYYLNTRKQSENQNPDYNIKPDEEPTNKTLPGTLLLLSMLLGIARLCQGVNNHKPVGYLIELLIFNSMIYFHLWRFHVKKKTD